MIETSTAQAPGRVDHVGAGTVNVRDLLEALDATIERPSAVLWDFRKVHFQVPLWIVSSPSYHAVRERLNHSWQASRVGFVVESHMHKQMIELFANEGGFGFDWKVFFDKPQAQCWLTPALQRRSATG